MEWITGPHSSVIPGVCNTRAVRESSDLATDCWQVPEIQNVLSWSGEWREGGRGRETKHYLSFVFVFSMTGTNFIAF